jgi:nicotinate-nucleotide adenylyltransferase
VNIAVLGGTFDPIHNGHLFLAEQVLALGYARVIFVPSFKPAHKEVGAKDEPALRLEMTRLACAGRQEFIVEDCEIAREGTSYTIQTIGYLGEKYGFLEKPGLVIGDDLVAGFGRWKKAGDLKKAVKVIIAHRLSKEEVPFEGDHIYLENSILPLSSSEIRRRIAAGKAYRYLVPEAVYGFIRSRGLYLG